MSKLHYQSFSRRSLIAGMLGVSAALNGSRTGAVQNDRPASIDLGSGLEIRDYRLFPTKDVMRFIVEIHNTTDTAVDSPALGLTLPHLPSAENFGWANPVSIVLHPHSSDCLIGVAPQALASDDDWGDPRWVKCQDLSTERSERLVTYDLSMEPSVRILNPQEAHIYLDLTNLGDAVINNWVMFQPILWDDAGRVCGAVPSLGYFGIEPKDTVAVRSILTPESEYRSNPFALIDSLENISATFSQQPGVVRYNPSSCDSILPWNN